MNLRLRSVAFVPEILSQVKVSTWNFLKQDHKRTTNPSPAITRQNSFIIITLQRKLLSNWPDSIPNITQEADATVAVMKPIPNRSGKWWRVKLDEYGIGCGHSGNGLASAVARERERCREEGERERCREEGDRAIRLGWIKPTGSVWDHPSRHAMAGDW